MDTVTNFAIGTDKIDLSALSAPGSLTRVADVATLDTAGLATQLGTSFASIAANAAGLVVISAGTAAGTYLYVNDATAAFNASADVFIKLVGTTGTMGDAGALTVADYFA